MVSRPKLWIMSRKVILRPICRAGRFSRTATRRERRKARRAERSRVLPGSDRAMRGVLTHLRRLADRAPTPVSRPRGWTKELGLSQSRGYWHHQGKPRFVSRLGSVCFPDAPGTRENWFALNESMGDDSRGPARMYGRVRTRKSRDPMFPGIETATQGDRVIHDRLSSPIWRP